MKNNNERQKIVILGHTGFLGSCLYNNFSKEIGYEIYGFSSADINLSLPKECRKLLNVIDKKIIVIMAAASLVKSKDFASFRNDLDMLNNLAEILLLVGAKHLIYISSVAIYGRRSDLAITELSQSKPDDFYSLSKVWGELILSRICLDSEIPLTILRPGTIYGRNDLRSPLFRFFNRIQGDKEIEIYGDGSSKLFWVHKMDLYRIVRSVITGRQFGDYNIVSEGNGISLLKLAELMLRVCRRENSIKFIPSQKSPVNLRFDISKLKLCFPEVGFIRLEDGLKGYLD
ncbi:MAG: NAD(P)-dependent oxidoreductase [Candidatus Azambacteria bacterium]|nr:NAD(P)-dependent oxidoreductase [Candidatus Azambacteria bacterium]